jgi:hypothetical protein
MKADTSIKLKSDLLNLTALVLLIGAIVSCSVLTTRSNNDALIAMVNTGTDAIVAKCIIKNTDATKCKDLTLIKNK